MVSNTILSIHYFFNILCSTFSKTSTIDVLIWLFHFFLEFFSDSPNFLFALKIRFSRLAIFFFLTTITIYYFN